MTKPLIAACVLLGSMVAFAPLRVTGVRALPGCAGDSLATVMTELKAEAAGVRFHGAVADPG